MPSSSAPPTEAAAPEVKKKTWGRPFARGKDPRRKQDEPPRQSFSDFARDLLDDPRVQRAFKRKARSGDINASDYKLLVDRASPVVVESTADAERRLIRRQLARLDEGEQIVYYALIKKMMGESRARIRWPANDEPEPEPEVMPDRPAERPLSETRPLALARERLREDPPAIIERGPRLVHRGPTPTEPVQPVVIQVVGPVRYATADHVPRQSPRPEDRDGRSSLVMCGGCGLKIPEEREVCVRHADLPDNRRCRRASLTQV